MITVHYSVIKGIDNEDPDWVSISLVFRHAEENIQVFSVS